MVLVDCITVNKYFLKQCFISLIKCTIVLKRCFISLVKQYGGEKSPGYATV